MSGGRWLRRCNCLMGPLMNETVEPQGSAAHAQNDRIWTSAGVTELDLAAAPNSGYFDRPGGSSQRAAEPRLDCLPSRTEPRTVNFRRECRSAMVAVDPAAW